LPRPRLRSSGNAWREKRCWVGSSKSTSRSRGRRRPSSSGKTRPRSSTGSWYSSAFRTRTCASPSRSRRPRFVTCGERPRKHARPSTRRGSSSKVGFVPAPSRSLIWLAQDLPLIVVFSVVGFQACGPPWGLRPPRPRLRRRPTTPRNRSWRSCGLPPSRSARRLKKARGRPGARWRVAYVPSAGMSPSACAVRFTWASRRPLAWWLSVRNMVPTLTSSKRRGLSLNGRC
jgi:hypothetical protein